MLDDEYLLYGLDALSRAHVSDYFADGHRGAAMIAAYYFCREASVEDGVSGIVRTMLDEHWTHTALCTPFPREPAEPAGVAKIVTAMEHCIVGLRQAGHNVILPTLALRAFRQLPHAVTRSRVDGVCRLVKSFTTVADIGWDDADDMPELKDDSTAAEFILSELPETMQAFDGRGQGWSGHLLTYGKALVDLRHLGYGPLAHKGEQGFKLYVKRIRMGPLEIDKPRPEHPPGHLRPHERAYWETHRDNPVGIGHIFKYPYGFYGLMNLARDPDLKHRCMQAAYRLF